MKKILLIFCFLLGFQMNADAVVVESYVTPIPNYFETGTVINAGAPYYYDCEPYYPYYCRKIYYTTGTYISPYININLGWGRSYHRIHPYHHHITRPVHYHHSAPARPHHGAKISPSNHHTATHTTHRSHSGGSHSHGSPRKK